jgi:hypothetical protein
MNPLTSHKCARRVLMALAAVSGIFLAVGCGSSNNNPPINPVGFNNASLTGTYVFSSTGVDVNGATLSIAGALTSNGTGGITGGTMDVVDLEGPVSVAQAISSGTYSIGADGRGQIKINSSDSNIGSINVDVVLSSTSHGLLTEFDLNGSGSGTIDLQTPLTGISQLAGPYAYTMAGTDGEDDPFATAGAFTFDSGGAITNGSGIEDFNVSGIPYPAETVTGGIVLGTGTGPAVATLTTSAFNTLTFDVYPIDATHFKFIETDAVEFLAGDVYSQTGATIPTGNMVFTMGGADNNGPVANGGLFNSDGAGNFNNGLEDINDGGNVSVGQLPFTGTSGSLGSAPIGGRVLVGLGGFDPATQIVIYPFSGSAGNGLLMLEMDDNGVMVGAALAQTATAFSAANYGLNLTGENSDGETGGEVDDIGQFNATATASPATNMTGVLDENDQGAALISTTLSGTYTPDSPATGRGSIVVTTPGTLIGGLSLEYYVVDSATTVFIDLDSGDNGFPQVGLGSFELQTAPSGGGVKAMAKSGGVVIVHPTVRTHGKLHKKK